MLVDALKSGDLAESLLGQQAVIERLSEALLTRLGQVRLRSASACRACTADWWAKSARITPC
jgi:hypothetical protein